MQARAVIIVRGLVQGVGFRYYIRRAASQAGLSGHAENLVNGDVRIVAEGERGLIEDLVKTARIGPRSSHVAAVIVEWEKPANDVQGFEIR
ncbi:MAG: acylphosphatase [Bacteroidota bacterium]